MLIVVDEPLLRWPFKVHLEQEGEALSALAQVAEDFSAGLRNIPQRDCDSTRIMRVPRFVCLAHSMRVTPQPHGWPMKTA
jgi:hypothetical protein